MKRKDYEKIAAVIRANREQLDEDQCEWNMSATEYGCAMSAIKDIARGLADMLAADNPRFDRARFLAACGLG